jgi:hypothetical protein
MISPDGKFLRAVALLIACCVMQVYVFAEPTVPPTNSPLTDVSPQAGGTIKTTDNKPVLVNGNNVTSGTTILSGSTVETPAGVSATIQLGFAEVDIAPGSVLVLDFTPNVSVKVTLKQGCVTLRMKDEAQGTIVAPDGTTIATGDRKVANVCYPNKGAAPVVSQTASGVSGADRALLILLIASTAGIVTYALVLAGRGQNPSPSSP